MKAVVAAFNQEKALVGAFSVITNLRMDLFEALVYILDKYWFDCGIVPPNGLSEPRWENINDKRILSVQVIVCIVMYHCTYKEDICINMNNLDVIVILEKILGSFKKLSAKNIWNFPYVGFQAIPRHFHIFP